MLPRDDQPLLLAAFDSCLENKFSSAKPSTIARQILSFPTTAKHFFVLMPSPDRRTVAGARSVAQRRLNRLNGSADFFALPGWQIAPPG
jgi:hypothetical protein